MLNLIIYKYIHRLESLCFKFDELIDNQINDKTDEKIENICNELKDFLKNSSLKNLINN